MKGESFRSTISTRKHQEAEGSLSSLGALVYEHNQNVQITHKSVITDPVLINGF